MTRINFSVDGFEHRSPIPAVTQIGPLYTTSPIPPFGPGRTSPSENVETQAADLFEMIGAHLSAAGIDWDDLAKIDFYVADMDHRSEIDSEWLKRFPHVSMRPARHVHHQPSLSSGAKIMATFVAYRES